MSARIYIEGGGDSKELGIRLQMAFKKLFERLGFGGRLPSLRWGGGREQTFDKFKTANRTAPAEAYVAMMVDSEEPVADIEQPWAHLKYRDAWDKPSGVEDDQVLLMVTCMETWVLTDRRTLRFHFGAALQESALPALSDLESRDRADLQTKLLHATRGCTNAYSKGKRSFDVVAKLDPTALRQHLPSFVRMERILADRL